MILVGDWAIYWTIKFKPADDNFRHSGWLKLNIFFLWRNKS